MNKNSLIFNCGSIVIENVRMIWQRFHVFYTRSLVERNVEARAWMEKNAFNILLWMVKEMGEHKKLIDQAELFFHRRIDDQVSIKV